MVASTLDPGLGLVAYGVLLVVVPLSFVLLFRVIDGLALDGFVEQYEEASPEAGRGLEATPTAGGDGVVCPQCGERNAQGFTFCRACQARISG